MSVEMGHNIYLYNTYLFIIFYEKLSYCRLGLMFFEVCRDFYTLIFMAELKS